MFQIISVIIIWICVRAAEKSLWALFVLNLSASLTKFKESDMLLLFSVRLRFNLVEDWELIVWKGRMLSSSETVEKYYTFWIDSSADVSDSSVMPLKGALLTAVAEEGLIEVFSEFNHCWDILVEGFIAEFDRKASEI